MSKIGIVENGLRKRRGTKRRRRNPVAVAKAKNPARRRSISLASARSVIKKNGLKAVSMKANGRKKHKRRRRNGLVTSKAIGSRRNGFFGNTKSDAKQVLSLGAGALGVKAVGRALSAVIQPFLAQIGAGNYATIITDAGLALFVAPYVGAKLAGNEAAKMVRLGGLLVVGLDLVEQFAPNALGLNPFNNSPIVMTGAGAAVAPAAVAALAKDVETGRTTAAKVGQAMRSLDAAGAQASGGGSNYISGASPELVV